MDSDIYAGREQTFVKHFILQRYLERFAHIVGSRWQTLTYVDCFSGPWSVRSDSLADSSFAIALSELRKARDTHAQHHRKIQLRCFFLEKNPVAYARLREFADSVNDAVVETRNATLEESVPAIVDFVRRGREAFPFILIDPTGWTGFAMETIEPLLRLNPSEVMINFMTGHIRRFIDSPQEETQESFRRLFGSDTFRQKIQGLKHQDREDAAVAEYAKNVSSAGGFSHVCSAIVLHPQKDRTHFHLLYATRNTKGVEVFKDAERKAMAAQEGARAGAQQRQRLSQTGQPSFLSDQELHDPSYYNTLRDRYLERSKDLVSQKLASGEQVLYDDAWALALSQPMTWESDLKQWIKEWRSEGKVDITGLKPRQKVPQREEGNYLVCHLK
jgi:three-Cys-motif partner protein